MKVKVCKKCGFSVEGEKNIKVFFRKNGAGTYTCPRSVCIGCELTQRTEQKKKNRPLMKARQTFYFHADRYIKRGLARSRKDFAVKFHWNPEQMARDIEHAFSGNCPYCDRPFAEMPNGLADVTLDILDPNDLPYYNTNTKWVCATDNREKRHLSAEEWGAKLSLWDQWRKHKEMLQIDPLAGLPLFELVIRVRKH